MIDKGTCLRFYKRKDIQQEMVEHAQQKEFSIRYGESFGKRPDILMYPKEILELALKGVTSFHCSEEIWENPLDLSSTTTKKELDQLRIGWDLVLDIDCKFIDYSKISADLIIKFLKRCEVKDYSIKFSVTGDTPILIKHQGKISLTPIKEVISIIKRDTSLEVLSVDEKNKVCFSKINGYLEHQEKVYDIFHENSTLPLRATGYHSVFVWKKGEIVQKEVNKLSKNDFLISFNNCNYSRQVGSISWEYFYLNKKVSREIKITPSLMLLLGYFLAEGHLTKTINQIGFTFNSNEEDYIEECVKLLTEITQKKISIRHPNPSSTQILIHSKEWYSFFEKYCGKGAKNKHVPEFSWSLPRDYFLVMLKGYLRGDGCKTREYSITTKSVSHSLVKELVWLCKINHISCSLNQEFCKEHKLPQGNLFKGSHCYTFNIPKSELRESELFRQRNKYSPFPKDQTFPTDGLKEAYYQLKPGMFNKHRLEQVTLNKRCANLTRIKKVIDWFEKYGSIKPSESIKKIISNYNKLFESDITTLRVKEIRSGKEEQVYDISVDKTERFFGGEYPILLHNSGNKGFHIGVPFEAFPSTVGTTPTKLLFPEAARKIAAYIKENIKEELGKRILAFENNDFSKIKDKVELPPEDITGYEKNQYGDQVAKLNVDKFLEIDTILIAPRHLYRMPYSLHEKSGLVSLPIDPERVMEFERSMADPDKILTPMFKFMDRNVSGPSARKLLTSALDFQTKTVVEKEVRDRIKIDNKDKNEETMVTSPIREEFFPPCMKGLLNGMEDGKKRAVFCWSNFLGKIGWSKKELEGFLLEWNHEKNKANPLRDNYIESQLRYFKPGEKLPPNCNNEGYYKSFGVCKPDSLCSHIKNPVNYTLLRWKDHLHNKEEEEKELAKEAKKQANEIKKQERDVRRAEREKKKTEKEVKPEEKS